MGNCRGAPAEPIVEVPLKSSRDETEVEAATSSSLHPAQPRHATTTGVDFMQVQGTSDANRGPEGNQVEWLNFVAKEIWPFVVKAVEKVMKDDVQKALQESLFSGIKFTEFSLGRNAPELGPINVNRVGRFDGDKGRSGGHPGVELGIGVNWNADAKITLHVTGANVGIKKLNLKGEVFIILCPLMNSLPIVGGLQITMVSPPKLDWEFSGMAQVVDMPQIARALKDIVKKLIVEQLVLPNRIFIHWVWGREHEIDISAMQYPMPEALLRIGIVEARGLEGRDWHVMGKATSDPYAKVTLGDREFTTPVIKNNLDPRWGEDGWHDFLMYTKAQHLTVELFDQDAGPLGVVMRGSDDSLGELVEVNSEFTEVKKIRLEDMLLRADAWWPIYIKKGKRYEAAGEVHIIIEDYQLMAQKSALQSTPPPHGKANADCLLSVQLRGLRGLPKKFASDAVIEVTLLDKSDNDREVMKTKSIKSKYMEEVRDPSDIDVDPTVQRLVEFLYFDNKSNQEIQEASGLTKEQVHRILVRRPSFHSKFNQSIHLLVQKPKELKLHLKLIVAGDTKNAAPIEAVSLDVKEKLIDKADKNNDKKDDQKDDLAFEDIVKLTRSTQGIAGVVEGPFELDIRVQLNGLVARQQGQMHRSGRGVGGLHSAATARDSSTSPGPLDEA